MFVRQTTAAGCLSERFLGLSTWPMQLELINKYDLHTNRRRETRHRKTQAVWLLNLSEPRSGNGIITTRY